MVLPTSVFAAPVWTDGLDADGDAAPAVVPEALLAGLDGLMTDCVTVLTPVLVLVTLPYDGGTPPPDGLTIGGGITADVTTGGGGATADVTTGGEE